MHMIQGSGDGNGKMKLMLELFDERGESLFTATNDVLRWGDDASLTIRSGRLHFAFPKKGGCAGGDDAGGGCAAEEEDFTRRRFEMAFNGKSWSSDTRNGEGKEPYCAVGGWTNPETGLRVRNSDCWFEC